MTKNSHVGGEKGGCKSGKYAPICCQSVTAQTDSKQCFATTADHIFSGSLALRQDTSGITSYSYDSGAVEDDDDDDNDDDDTSLDKKKRKAKRNNRDLQERGLGSWAGSCAEAVTLPLGAIPIDVPALLIQSYTGAGIELEPITVSASASKKARKTIPVHS